MIKLITRNDIAQYRQVSKTPFDDKLNEMILDAQMLDIQPLIGESLYNKIMAAPEDYTELLDGGSYVYDGKSYTNYGLKMVICYFTYARYLMFASTIDTPSGFKEKLGPDSQPVDISTKKTMYGLNRDAAFQIWENVKNYLIRTEQLDFNRCSTTENSSRGFRITKIG